MRRLNVLLSVARTFLLLESTECPVSWQCSWTADESLERCSWILVSSTREVSPTYCLLHWSQWMCNTVHLLRFSVVSLTCTNCNLRELTELTGLWTIVTSCDLNALCRRSEMPLMYGTEAVFTIACSSPRFFPALSPALSLALFFARAPLSERLEQAIFTINISKSECKGKGEDLFRIKWPERPI